jgi:hypothetical protein
MSRPNDQLYFESIGAALRIDMMTKLAKAPRNTVIRGCRVAMIAAIRKVLSP